MSWSHRRKTVAAIIGAVGGLTVAAVAAFVVIIVFSGANTATVKTSGSITGLTAATSCSTGQMDTLAPGDTKSLCVRVDNESGGPLHLTHWTVVDRTVLSSDGACGTSNFAAPDLTLSVAVPTGVSVVYIPNAVSFSATPEAGCSNAVLSVDGNGTFGF